MWSSDDARNPSGPQRQTGREEPLRKGLDYSDLRVLVEHSDPPSPKKSDEEGQKPQ